MENLRVAVIGIGNMGSAHANCIYNGDIKGLTLSNAAYLSSWKGNCEISLPINTEELDAFFDKLCENSTFLENAVLKNNIQIITNVGR